MSDGRLSTTSSRFGVPASVPQSESTSPHLPRKMNTRTVSPTNNQNPFDPLTQFTIGDDNGSEDV